MPRSGDSPGANSSELGDKVLALLRYYSSGKRSAFIQQIARKSVSIDQSDAFSYSDDWWQIYRRLSDFGLITQKGRATDVTWQWTGDRLSILSEAEVLFPASSSTLVSFAKLCSRHVFQKEVVYRCSFESVGDFSIRYLVSEEVEDVLRTIKQEALPIEASVNHSILPYLPSAQEVFSRTANRTVGLPEVDDLEQRGASSNRWLQCSTLEPEVTCLLRKAREDRPGFRYWLIQQPGHQVFELQDSDWLPLLLWWVAGRKWSLGYDPQRSQLFVPKGLYFSLPALLRHALILHSMRWPATDSGRGQHNFVFANLPTLAVSHLVRLYAPALKVSYVK